MRDVVAPMDSVADLPRTVAQAPSSTLLELRRLCLSQLIRENPRELESDGSGLPVRRGVLVAVDPDPASLALASRAGFRVLADTREDALAIRSVALAVPRAFSARGGLKRLRRIARPARDDWRERNWSASGSADAHANRGSVTSAAGNGNASASGNATASASD